MTQHRIDPDWERWVRQSTVIHFDSKLNSSFEFYVEGRRRPKEDNYPRVELRIDGPTYRQTSNNVFFLTMEIDILVMSTRNDRDLYDHSKLTGTVANAMRDAIPIIKHGGDETTLGCMELQEEVVVTKFQAIEDRVIPSTVEGVYQLCIVLKETNGSI